MAVTIVLDAGHGGYDNGATYQGRREKDDTLDLTLALGDYLTKQGVSVLYTRTEDQYDSPVRKAQIANETGADYFISLHRNSSPQPNQYQGVQTLLYDENGKKAELADAVNAKLAEAGFQNLGNEVRKNLAVLRRTRMPAILIEAGFLNSDNDNAIWDANFDGIVRAIGDAVLETLAEEIAEPAAETGNVLGNGEAEPKEEVTAQEAAEMLPKEETPAGEKKTETTHWEQEPQDTIRYTVQVGLFRNPENADRMYRELTALGIPADIDNTGSFLAVRAGGAREYQEALQLQKELTELGLDALLVAL